MWDDSVLQLPEVLTRLGQLQAPLSLYVARGGRLLRDCPEKKKNKTQRLGAAVAHWQKAKNPTPRITVAVASAEELNEPLRRRLQLGR